MSRTAPSESAQSASGDEMPVQRPPLTALCLGALGVVFGDIGTSPLYTMKAMLALNAGSPDAGVILGLLSLVIWTLVIVTTIKYVALAMSADNDGEGGILALLSLLLRKAQRPAVIACGLFGAALIYGDGAITPAISVLSALEGLEIVTPSVEPWILPSAVGVLVLLFAVQPFGTAVIGKAFGPVMLTWFLVLAVLGIVGILKHPAVLAALNPLVGLSYLAHAGAKGGLVLGAAFLCATGSEALYADMGHFGSRPIRISWLGLVFPCLLLNYAGQAAIVIKGAPAGGNVFFQLCPVSLTIPLVGLATAATVIASQAIISGAFSMTRQAIRLGWMPRLTIRQTSEEGAGQIYVGPVNWILMAATIALTIGFRKSDALASAYGIAVSVTMLMTTILLFLAIKEIWKWSTPVAVSAAGLLLTVDLAFVGANSIKIGEGGYIPLLLASGVYAVMWIWHHGSAKLHRQLSNRPISLLQFKTLLEERRVQRVVGTAVFLTGTDHDVPPSLIWHVDRNRALHEEVIILKIVSVRAPRVQPEDRLTIERVGSGLWRATANFGFMERPDLPALLVNGGNDATWPNLGDVTYYVARAIVRPEAKKGSFLSHVEAELFEILNRNSSHVSDMFQLPADKTVELGRQVFI